MATARELLAKMPSAPSGEQQLDALIPKDPLGMKAYEDAAKDEPGIASLDPTNPRNLAGLAHTGIPMALQMLLTGMAGPEAGPALKMGASGLGSLLGYVYQAGVEPLAKGQSPKLDSGEALLNFILGAGAEGGVQAGGAIERRLTGKTAMRAEGSAAEQAAQDKIKGIEQTAGAKAIEGQEKYDLTRTGGELDQTAHLADVEKSAAAAAQKALDTKQGRVQRAQDLVEQQKLKHSETALQGVREEEVAQLVNEHLGASAPLPAPTIESLSERATPVRQSVARNVRSVMSGISGKFESLLEPHYDTPVSGNFAAAVDSERANLETNKEQIGKNLNGLMNQLSSLDAKAAVQTETLPPMLKREYELLQRSGRFTPEQLDQHIRKIASGLQGPQAGGDMFTPPDVRRVDNIRKDLTKVVIGEGSAVEKRVANRLIGNIDENLSTVLPEQVRADWTNLRNEWREANNVFSPTFKSMLGKASSPEQVADVLYGSAKGKQADRVLMVIGKTPKDEMPLLRSAFADKLTRGDVVKNVQGIDKRVFKAFFPSGFDSPQEFVKALEDRIDLNAVQQNPELAARFRDRVQQGMKSLGTKRYQDALARAEAQLRATPDVSTAVKNAVGAELTPAQAGDVAVQGMTRPDVGTAKKTAVSEAISSRAIESPEEARIRGEMEGVRTPIIGKRGQSWMEHHTAWKVSLAALSLGTMSGLPHAGYLAIPLAYIAGNRAAAAALASPTRALIWSHMLKSKSFEQAGFWLGRLAAASLTEGIRSSDER